MTTALLDVATFIFVSVVILFCIVLLLSFAQRGAAKSAKRRAFIRASIAALAIYLLHLLSRESINSFASSSSKTLLRWDCLRSDKGGKRPFGIESNEYKHPCYNETAAVVAEIENDYLSPSSPRSFCSSTAAAAKYEKYISATRDCQGAKRSTCSLSEPCTPCEISRRNEFSSTWSRCQSCSIRNNFGDCNFRDGVGPYCWKNGDMLEVIPCEICCTDNMPMIDEEGACYWWWYEECLSVVSWWYLT